MSNTDFGRADDAGTAGSLKDAAMDAVGGVKQEVASFAASAQERLSDGADQQMDTAAKGLHVFAGAIRTAGEELAKQDQSIAGSLVKRAADGLEDLSRSLSAKDPEQLLDAVRQFGRDNPVAFAGASVLIGVALGRVARSSASDGAVSGKAAATERASPGAAPTNEAASGLAGVRPMSTGSTTSSVAGTPSGRVGEQGAGLGAEVRTGLAGTGSTAAPQRPTGSPSAAKPGEGA